MIFSDAIVLITLLNSVNGQCSYTSWNFKSAGQYMCSRSDYYMTSLERDSVRNVDNDPIEHLTGVGCCRATQNWVNVDQHIVYADWTDAFDKDYSWALCPVGYFLQGLYRSRRRENGYLFNIEAGRCLKPANHPLYYANCQIVDISYCISRKGKCSCPDGYITGMQRSGDDLINLKYIKCCTMAKTAENLDDVDKIKRHIMDITLTSMAYLAHFLGYGWCYGCRGLNVGEDFNRQGYSWVADVRGLWPNSCEGYKSNQRLTLDFVDWGFTVKEIKYEKPTTDLPQTVSFDSGTIYNYADAPVTDGFIKSIKIKNTIKHSTSSSWKKSHNFNIELNFNLSPFGASSSYKFNYETYAQTYQENIFSKTEDFTKHSSITLGPKQAANYTVFTRRQKMTIPYNAVVIAKFSTVFRGFLRWETSHGNFHHTLINNRNSPSFEYRFGNHFVPFYEALRNEISNVIQSQWLWAMMFQTHPSARYHTNKLIDEKQYEFNLNGTLEIDEGKVLDVVWKKMKL